MEAYAHLQKIEPSTTGTIEVNNLRQKCYDAMNDDLNTPIVISHLFDATRSINSIVAGTESITSEQLEELKTVFHLFLFDLLGLKEVTVASEGNKAEAYSKAIDLLLSIRQQAKTNKDWATSDQIRNELASFGFIVKDTKDGFEWKLD